VVPGIVGGYHADDTESARLAAASSATGDERRAAEAHARLQ